MLVTCDYDGAFRASGVTKSASNITIVLAYLIDKELQLKNSCSALVLAVAVHPWSSQSDDITKSRN